MARSQHVYEIRPREDCRGFNLIGDCLPLGLLWFEGPEAMHDAIHYARFFSRSNLAIIHVFDESGTVVEAIELAADFFTSRKNFCTLQCDCSLQQMRRTKWAEPFENLNV